ncbi:hypothetical protein RhiirA4_479428 [Rhizophagus irregularis]|uniref:Uncharacterized protein n=1 Tax=Rhizophagus irregularis TaxID=588596 RepID=A0A2I1HGE5_9GLOM|nr:hypothetical protein RhiirA4_479428 [Rhizophagus irregularis]
MRDDPQINDIDNLNLSMKKLPNTVISLILLGGIPCNTSLSFITNFKDLQELKIEYLHAEGFIGFEDLQHIIFPKLQILNFVYAFPKSELLMKFLKNNGNSLKEIYLFEKYINNIDNSINLAIAKFCPVLRKLSTAIKNNKLETLKIILDSCQYLESIKVCCGSLFLYEKEVLDTIMEYSKNIHEIILDYYEYLKVEILPEELESFFLNWKNLIPQRSLSLVVVDSFSGLYEDVRKRKIIKKYIKLGVIKEFKVKDLSDEDLYAPHRFKSAY